MTGQPFQMVCPLPTGASRTVQLAHGGGGRAMHRLIEEVFMPAFDPQGTSARHDSAVMALDGVRLAFTTDTYVVSPLFFPGGDIGKLAVFGTVNDLAVAGAKPMFLSVGFVLEEGLPLDVLTRVVQSMREAAQVAGVALVTGDTKVVDRGKGDGIFVNTAGIGTVAPQVDVRPARVQPDDVVLLSGDIGRHGVAIMSVREGLEFESPPESDCAPLHELAAAVLQAGGSDVHCMRDLTRGGLASALNEIAEATGAEISIDEAAVPVSDQVAGACSLLGLDPFYVANEGRMVTFVAPQCAEAVLSAMRSVPVGQGAAPVGHVSGPRTGDADPHAPSACGRVVLRTVLGNTRLLDMLTGEQLPRIC